MAKGCEYNVFSSSYIIHFTPTTFETDENFSIDKVKKSLVKTVKLHKLVVFSEAIK